MANKTKYVNMGRAEKNPYAVIVHAYEDMSPLPWGVFYGFVKENRVALYPADYVTRQRYKGQTMDISIYDLKARDSYAK